MSDEARRSRRALVTGGAGFIGGHLVEGLLADGWSVRVLDDFSSGREENLAGCRDGVELIRGDVCDTEIVSAAADGADVIFHQAAIASVARSIDNPRRAHAVNLGGTLEVLEAARRRGVRRVVFAGSAAVYGDDETLPKVESLPPACLSPYALHKYASEQYLAFYERLHGLQTVALRYFNVYGPRQDPESDYAAAIPLFVRAALTREPVRIFGDGEQTRDFVHVDDVVAANLRAAVADGVSGVVLNVASGRRTRVNDLVRIIGRCAGRELVPEYAPPRAADVRHSWADIGRARQLLGYSPAVELEAGLAGTVAAFAGAVG